MIKVEGYKAFRGTMKIIPIGGKFQPFEQKGDWLYKPDTKCWYGNGQSYHEDICEPVETGDE